MNVVLERPSWSVTRNCERCNSQLEITAKDLTVTAATKGHLIGFVCPICNDAQLLHNVFIEEIPKEQRPEVSTWQ